MKISAQLDLGVSFEDDLYGFEAVGVPREVQYNQIQPIQTAGGNWEHRIHYAPETSLADR